LDTASKRTVSRNHLYNLRLLYSFRSKRGAEPCSVGFVFVGVPQTFFPMTVMPL
jgi:hypothetical protein